MIKELELNDFMGVDFETHYFTRTDLKDRTICGSKIQITGDKGLDRIKEALVFALLGHDSFDTSRPSYLIAKGATELEVRIVFDNGDTITRKIDRTWRKKSGSYYCKRASKIFDIDDFDFLHRVLPSKMSWAWRSGEAKVMLSAMIPGFFMKILPEIRDKLIKGFFNGHDIDWSLPSFDIIRNFKFDLVDKKTHINYKDLSPQMKLQADMEVCLSIWEIFGILKCSPPTRLIFHDNPDLTYWNDEIEVPRDIQFFVAKPIKGLPLSIFVS